MSQTSSDVEKVRSLMERGGALEAQEKWKDAKLVYLELEEFVTSQWGAQNLADTFYANFAVVSLNAGDTAHARRLAQVYIDRTGSTGEYRDRVDQVLDAVERAENAEYRDYERRLKASLANVRQYPNGALINIEMSNIGLHYLFGRGTAKNCDRAAIWFADATNKGSSMGAEMLGDMHRIGLGVQQSYKRAIHWYERAIQLDNKSYRAMNNLGVMYHQGLGTPRDTAKAKSLFSSARSYPVPRANLALPAGATPRWFDSSMEAHTC